MPLKSKLLNYVAGTMVKQREFSPCLKISEKLSKMIAENTVGKWTES